MIFSIYFRIWAITFPILSVMDQSPMFEIDDMNAIKHLMSIPFAIVFLYTVNFRELAVKIIIILALLFSIHGLLSAALLNNLDISTLYVRFQVILSLMLFYVMAQHNVARIACKYFFYGIIISIIIFGALHVASGLDMSVYTNRDRFTLGFLHPGKFGNLFLTLALFANVLYFKKVNFYALMVAFIVIILFTFTRNIFVCLFVGIIVPVLWRYRPLILPTAGFVLIFIVYLLQTNSSYYQMVDSGSSGRLLMWAMGFRMNFVPEVDFLLLGGGNNLISPVETFTEAKNTTFRFDNSYLEIFLRDGFIGVLIAGVALWTLLKQLFPKEDWGYPQHIFWSTKYMMLFFFMFDSGLFSLGNLAFMGFCITALALQPSESKRENQ